MIQTPNLSCAVGNSFLIQTLFSNIELCCACAWLLSDERDIVNLLARGANIIALAFLKNVLQVREAVFALNGTTITMTRNVR